MSLLRVSGLAFRTVRSDPLHPGLECSVSPLPVQSRLSIPHSPWTKSHRWFCPSEPLSNGSVIGPNKTSQEIHAQWVGPKGEAVGRRAMHAVVFESAGWNCEAFMHRHRQVVAPAHRGRGRAVLSWIGRLRIILTARISTARKRHMTMP